jgi:septal ring factor EnvC (AmiA/AmiB activator)
MLTFEKDTKKNFLILILLFNIVIVLCFVLQLIFSKTTFENSEYLKKEVVKIENEIQKNQNENKALLDKVIGFEKEIDKIDNDIFKNKENLEILKNKTNEKIDSFKHFNARMWEDFFADRYSE